jgi:hypothetical protein
MTTIKTIAKRLERGFGYASTPKRRHVSVKADRENDDNEDDCWVR